MNRRHTQGGVSLISLMVGMALSMISVVALMMAYKGVVHSGNAVVANTTRVSQGVSLAVSTPRLILQAGWGMGATATPVGAAANTDLVLLSSSTLSNTSLTGTAATISSTSSTGTALVWDTKITGDVKCWALVSSGGGLSLLGPANCTAASNWLQVTWGNRTELAPPQSFTDLTFAVAKGSCWPYGGGPGAQPGVVVTLQALGTAANTLCLSNLPN